MKSAMIGATLVVASLFLTSVSQADNCCGGGFYSGLPYHGFGYSGSLYGLGYVPVPPYFALHPPVYYSHEIRRRPSGDSPHAYPSRRPVLEPRRQVSLNPFIPPSVEDRSQEIQATDAVATAMQNPFYGQALATSNPIHNPYYARPDVMVAQTDD